MDEQLWRARLGGQLPQALISHFNCWRSTWISQVGQFFSRNLVSNPEFAPQRMSVATGIGAP